ncbi:DUF6457 domain-containing protein [Xylanimonas sp. McL0601]|uniref:DUF6457 domain-containing protein n=1 Tax=Xylanimonas sp. McL0601 TaxID=3414739 RepID=UPI003CF8BA75
MSAQDSPDPQTLLARWVQSLERDLDLPDGTVDVDAVLDLTRDAAHNVARPAGPLAAYAAGYARALADVEAGAAAGGGTSDAVDRATALARAWTADEAGEAP